jgi:hypothetical protein
MMRANERRLGMNKALEAFLKDLYSEKKNGKQIYVELLVLSNIISGKLIDISNDFGTITLSDLHRNDKYLNITLTILSDNILGWNAKIND